MRFSFWPWKNPIERPSGAQKGSAAPSVPGRSVVASESIDRIEIPPSLENSFDVSATLRPSGETASEEPTSADDEDMSGKTRRKGGEGEDRRASAKMTAAATAISGRIQSGARAAAFCASGAEIGVS